MNCAETVAELGAYLDGQVQPGVSAGLDAHLAGCPACRERFAREAGFEGAVARALRSSPDQAQDDAAWEHALERTLAGAPHPVTPAAWWGRFRRPPSLSQLRWFALVASLALLATFSMAGLGLRRSLHATTPTAIDQQHALPGISR
jgi:anti-sigma factor RsiW